VNGFEGGCLESLGFKISKKEMEEINLRRDAFHGEWNYTMSPRSQKWVSIS
jgi:hypothetical protein